MVLIAKLLGTFSFFLPDHRRGEFQEPAGEQEPLKPVLPVMRTFEAGVAGNENLCIAVRVVEHNSSWGFRGFNVVADYHDNN
jgi:hypothetical protein